MSKLHFFSKTIPMLFLCFGLLTFSFQVNAQCPESQFEGVHVVQSNETLFGISRKYNISVDAICTWNSINKDGRLPACKELVVSATLTNPLPPNYIEPGANELVKVAKQAGKWHTVRKGETTEQIAWKYGYTEERFREFNHLPAWKKVKPGAVLRSSECICKPVSGSVSTPATTASTVSKAVPKSPDASTTTPTETESRGYMTVDESAMIDEINLMRSNPSAYVKHIRDYVAAQKKDWGYTVSSSALNSLIKDLQKSPTLSTLRPHQCLYQMAKKHGDYLKRTNRFSHSDENGVGPWSRTKKTCPQVKMSTSKGRSGMLIGNENLVAGNSTVRESVITLLLDEGLNPPGHRETLLAPEWRYVACYNYGTLNQMPNHYVQNFGR